MIAVTGAGAICSLGDGCDALFDNLCAFGTDGHLRHLRRPTHLAEDFGRPEAPVAAEVPLSNEALLRSLGLGGPRANRIGRATLLALKAIKEATVDAGLDQARIPPGRIGIFGGTAMGGSDHVERILREFQTTSRLRRPHLLPGAGYSEMGSLVARVFNWKGPRLMVSTACSSSTVAMFFARELLLDGQIDAAIVYGGDPLSEISIAGFTALGAYLDGLSAPFSTGTPGICLGEGAGALVLEREPHRPVVPYAWLGGVGVASECHHLTAPDPKGLGALGVMAAALDQAGRTRAEVDAIIAHGTGTELNDVTEARAIRLLEANDPLVLSTKGATGHMLGAAGILNAVVACLCMRKRQFPASPRFSSPRQGIDANLPTRTASEVPLRGMLTNSFGFGGSVASASFVSSGTVNRIGESGRKVVITGVGQVTPAGSTRDQLEQAILQGSRHFTPHPANPSFTGRTSVALAGTVDLDQDPDACKLLRRSPNQRKMDRFSRLGYAASAQALHCARFRTGKAGRRRTGIILGTGLGPRVIEPFYTGVVAQGPRAGNPSLFPNTVINACLGYITMDHLIQGPHAMIPQGEVASALAMYLSAAALARPGAEVDALLCGGVDEFSPFVEKGYLDLGQVPDGALSGGDTEPLHPGARGFLLGEASIVFLLESEASALERGAQVEAEWAGSFLSGDSFPARGAAALETAATADAISQVLDRATARFGLPDLLIANVTGLPAQRSRILEGIGRSPAAGVPLYSPLRVFGNCLGTSGALGVFAALTALRHQRLPSSDHQRLSRAGRVATVFVLSSGEDGMAVVSALTGGGSHG